MPLRNKRSVKRIIRNICEFGTKIDLKIEDTYIIKFGVKIIGNGTENGLIINW